VSKRTKILFRVAAFLAVAFAFFITPVGQGLLRRPYIHPGMSPFELDDVYMGSGLAPFVYLLAPGILVALAGIVSLLVDLRRAAKIRVHPR
jgi:hypothetical protein